MSEPMTERRKGQHSAVNRLAQTYADLLCAEQDVTALEEVAGKKHRALCFIREASAILRRVIDFDLGPKTVEGDKEGTHYEKEEIK